MKTEIPWESDVEMALSRTSREPNVTRVIPSYKGMSNDFFFIGCSIVDKPETRWKVLEHYNIENEEEYDEQEGQLSQLPHRKCQRRCHA